MVSFSGGDVDISPFLTRTVLTASLLPLLTLLLTDLRPRIRNMTEQSSVLTVVCLTFPA